MLVNDDQVWNEMQDRGMRTDGVGPDNDDRIAENFFRVKEELEASQDRELNQQLRAILESCGTSEEDAIKAAVKFQEFWPEDADHPDYKIGSHDFCLEYKDYLITHDGTSWLFEDCKGSHGFERYTHIMDGLLTTDAIRKQGL